MDPHTIWDGEWSRSSDGCIRVGGYCRRGRNSFRGEFEASYCNQWALCCVVVRVCAASQLLFGVGCGVTPGMHALDMGPRAPKGKGCFGDFLAFAPSLV